MESWLTGTQQLKNCEHPSSKILWPHEDLIFFGIWIPIPPDHNPGSSSAQSILLFNQGTGAQTGHLQFFNCRKPLCFLSAKFDKGYTLLFHLAPANIVFIIFSHKEDKLRPAKLLKKPLKDSPHLHSFTDDRSPNKRKECHLVSLIRGQTLDYQFCVLRLILEGKNSFIKPESVQANIPCSRVKVRHTSLGWPCMMSEHLQILGSLENGGDPGLVSRTLKHVSVSHRAPFQGSRHNSCFFWTVYMACTWKKTLWLRGPGPASTTTGRKCFPFLFVGPD